MKKSIIVIILICLSVSAKAENIDVVPLNMNFTGTVVSGGNIICYSDVGAYIISTDKGKTWQQHSIELEGSITRIVNNNDTLYGIFPNGLLIKSVDNGLSWQKKSSIYLK